MNCLEFEGRVEILARGALADARTRAAAEEHGETCAPCAARLADERSLSVGLRALADGMRTAEAPPRVEASLLAAFRARAATVTAEGSGGAAAGREVVAMSGRAPARRLSWAKTVAVASMAAAASLAVFMLVRPDAPVPQRAMIEPPPAESSGVPPARAVAHDTSTAGRENVAPSPSPEGVEDRATRGALAPRPRMMNASLNGNGRVGGRARRANAADARPLEVATEFIPLGQGAPYTQTEEGHLVRVELPRSALASFGLPVNAEAPQGRVKADVLLGQDGVARAIRFVR